ncbi:hypothetical protein JB92DRAFT_3147236 [Gautieria morchelliformis]|nr:hypothetical protein JB92DRAFT_3147236 [Gautieria morchelliformis]
MSVEGHTEETIPSLIDITHDDGDTVLSVRKAHDVQHADAEFRVHRAIISLHGGSVLRHLVEAADPSEYVDGRPVIPCYGDSVEDFSALLMALYNGLALLHDNYLTLDVALAILRLSDKYRFEALQRGITRVLFENWPLNYDDYISRQEQWGSPGSRIIKSMKLVKTAQQCKAWELLPAAFYEIAATQPLEWDDIELSSCEKYLTHPDLARILRGRESAVKRLQSLLHWGAFGHRPQVWDPDNSIGPDTVVQRWSTGCTKRQTFCQEIPRTLMSAISVELVEGTSPLSLLSGLTKTQFEAAGICTSCVDWVFHRVLENKKREIWHNVVVDFELPEVDPKLYSERTFHSL